MGDLLSPFPGPKPPDGCVGPPFFELLVNPELVGGGRGDLRKVGDADDLMFPGQGLELLGDEIGRPTPIPESISSKMSVLSVSASLPTDFRASITRDNSPPEAIF